MKQLSAILLAIFFVAQLPSQSFQWKNFTSNINITGLCFEDDHAWISTTGGLVRMDTTNFEFTVYNRENSDIPYLNLRNMSVDTSGVKWFATDLGLISFDGTTFQRFVPPGYQNYPFWKVECDQTDKIWAMSGDYNLWQFDGNQWKYYNTDDLWGADVNAMIAGAGDEIWLQCWQSGKEWLIRFNGSVTTEYDNDNSPIPIDDSPEIWKLSSDGLLYVKYSDFPLYTFDGEQWDTIITPNNYWSDLDFAFKPDGNGIIALTGSKLFDITFGGQLTGKTLPQYVTKALDFSNYSKESISIDPLGRIWITTGRGLFMTTDQVNFMELLPGKTKMLENIIAGISVTNSQFVMSLEASDLSNWGGTFINSISSFRNGKWKNFANDDNPYKEAGAPGFFGLQSITHDNSGWHWISQGPTLYRYNGTNWGTCNNSLMNDPGDYILSVAADPTHPQRVWTLTYYSLFKLENGVFSEEALTVPGHYFNKIEVDSEGNLWLAGSASQGVWRLKSGIWEHFDKTTIGFTQYAFIVQDIAAGPGGRIALATDDGVYAYDRLGTWTGWNVVNTGNPDFYAAWTVAFDGAEKIWAGFYYPGCFSLPQLSIPPLGKLENNQWTFYPYLPSQVPSTAILDLQVDTFHNVWIGSAGGGIGILNENQIVLNAPDGSGIGQPTIDVTVTPNPSANQFRWTIRLPVAGDILLRVFNSKGEIIAKKEVERLPSGLSEIKMDGSNWPAGVYYYDLTVGEVHQAGTITKI